MSRQHLKPMDWLRLQAYRKQAAIWHPDKAKTDQAKKESGQLCSDQKRQELQPLFICLNVRCTHAGLKFMQIKEAQDLLLDVKARAALDDVIR